MRIEVTGVLDHATAPRLRRTVLGLLDGGTPDVTLQLRGVRLVDAAAIRVLLDLGDRAEHRGARLRVAGARGIVLTALEIAGAAKRLGVYDPPEGTRHWPAGATERLRGLATLDPADPRRARERAELIEACLPAAHRLTRRYAGAGEPFGDLAQVASLGLVRAVDGFDPGRGVEFAAYAAPTILGELRRYLRDRTAAIRLPRPMQDPRPDVNGARDGLTRRLRRCPTVADLAAVRAFHPLSLDAPAAGSHDGTVLDTLGADDPQLDLVELRTSLRRLIAALPRRERQIVALRFYGGLTQAEIAGRLGLSQMHVSRLLRQTLNHLRRHLSE